MDPILKKFEDLTKLSIVKKIGKIPETTCFYDACNNVLEVISTKHKWSASLNFAMCGVGHGCHTAYYLSLVFINNEIASLVVMNHYDNQNNIELILTMANGDKFTNVDKWWCMLGEPVIFDDQVLSYNEILNMLD